MLTNIFFVLLLSLPTSGQTYFSGKVGAERTDHYISLIQNKNIAIVANQTSCVDSVHIVDTLLSRGVNVVSVFSPEHGFRGTADAGEQLHNSIDSLTQLPIISLYGNQKKPSPEHLKQVDVVLFDIQDVGVRFYTYISTLHYVMEACAENDVACIVLDRPNPNGFYIAGPVLEPEFSSFVGMHPVPIVHGMTIGEYAQMINGEGWLHNSVSCNLSVIKCDTYKHSQRYTLPIPPSPNLPTMQSIYLYPTLCLFEGTVMSCGRGTDFPFEVIGAPDYSIREFSFVPRSIPGASKNPRYKGTVCYGHDLRTYNTDSVGSHGLFLDILKQAYTNYPHKEKFFTSFFYTLSGTKQLRKSIEHGLSQQDIQAIWQDDLREFQHTRKKYLLYTDF
ncbi:MAG: DUF1343 domain-containing protein [Bacteroidales bacterium]